MRFYSLLTLFALLLGVISGLISCPRSFAASDENAVRAAYEAQIYGDVPQMDWGDDNAYFAMIGLFAPADVADSYAWGRMRALREAYLQEERKKAAHVNPAYIQSLPSYNWSTDLGAHTSPLFVLDIRGLGNWACLYENKELSSPEPCATYQDLEAAISHNQVLWERFEALPDRSRFMPILAFGVTKGREITINILQDEESNPLYAIKDFIILVKMKAAHIVLAGHKGYGDAAVKEWLRFMVLYRNMLSTPQTFLDKTISMVVMGVHLKTLETLIVQNPDAVRAHSAELHKVLMHSDAVYLYDTKRMFVWDLVSSYGLLIASIQKNLYFYPTEAIEDTHLCLKSVMEYGQLPAHKIFLEHKDLTPQCTKMQDFPTDTLGVLWYWISSGFMHPKKVQANLVTSMLYSFIIDGKPLINAAHIADTKTRMTRLAVEILAQGIKDADIPAFAASVGEEMQNPITRSAFLWDAQKRTLYFENPTSKYPVELALPPLP